MQVIDWMKSSRCQATTLDFKAGPGNCTASYQMYRLVCRPALVGMFHRAKGNRMVCSCRLSYFIFVSRYVDISRSRRILITSLLTEIHPSIPQPNAGVLPQVWATVMCLDREVVPIFLTESWISGSFGRQASMSSKIDLDFEASRVIILTLAYV